MKRTISGVGVIGLMVVVGSPASAPAASTQQGRPGLSSPVAAGQQQVQPLTATVKRARHLKTTALSTGDAQATATPGLTAIDAVTTLNCPGTTTCTFEADQNVEASGSTANNPWAICTKVDGINLIDPECPSQGFLPNGYAQAGSFIQSKSGLLPGSHTVQTFIYTVNGGVIGKYAIIYRVYTP